MIKGTVVLIGAVQDLEPAIKNLRNKKYSVIAIEQWPHGNYVQAPMYCVTPVQEAFGK